MNKEISSYLLKLRQSHPFLATLSLYMRYQFTDRVSQFDTDGREARINSKYFESLDKQQRIGTLLHVTLHSALLHPVRRGLRIAEIWNVAADIVVNQIIAETSFEPPPNTAVEPRYAELSVEQVYTKLLSSASKAMTAAGSLSAPAGASQDADEAQNSGSQGVANEAGTSEPRDAALKVEGGPSDHGPHLSVEVQHSSSRSPSAKPNRSDAGRGKPQNAATTQDSGADQNTSSGSLAGATEKEQRLTQAIQTLYPSVEDLAKGTDRPGAKAEQKKLESHWKQAMRRAQTAEMLHAKSQGDLPEGLVREIEQVLNPLLDWRIILWRFMARTPCDYSGYDRRFIHQGLYLDRLESDSLRVHIAMDTSGSIDEVELSQFRAEVESIVRCYGSIEAQLYFVDAEVYGPYPLDTTTKIDRVAGGGGTDFTVFFDELKPDIDPFAETLCIYLTDGFGEFPETPPPLPVLWVVTNEGSDVFPFGEVTRLAH